jgi:hypothetical protein
MIERDTPISRETRRAEVDDRIRELHARNEELARQLGTQGEPEPTTPGARLAQARQAEAFAQLSHARAVAACHRAAVMRLRAASAHEHAAQGYESFATAAGGKADSAVQDKADQHRRQAAVDRAAAADLLGIYEAHLHGSTEPSD